MHICDLINMQDDEGFTPVHHAVVGNHIDAVLWLLNENNADAGINTKAIYLGRRVIRRG